MNPKDSKDMNRLHTAMESSRRKLEPFRRRHRESIEQYVGVYYSDDAANKPVHVNLMELATNIYMQNLASRPPRVSCYCSNPRFRSQAKKLEVVMNQKLTDYKLHEALQRAVRSALFSMGIVKVGLQSAGEFSVDGFEFSRTAPFVESVLLDDWVHDMTARVPEEVSFEGHRFRMLRSEALEDKSFRKNVREKLRSYEPSNHNESGDERLHTLSQGYSAADEEMDPRIELWEIYLPKEKKLLTIIPNDDGPPLRVIDWEGPDGGPFHKLFFNEVDGQSMPLAPAMLWQGLHRIVNGLYRKLDRQAQRVKHIGVTRGEDSEDAERIRMASDGEVVAVDNPDAIQAKSFGGVDQSNFAFMLQSKEMFSWLNGNLDALGGLGPQAETLGQDQLLYASANQRVSGMQDRVYLFTKQVLHDFGFYLWENPTDTYEAEVDIGGGFAPIESPLTPSDRSGVDYYNYEINVEPHSMQYRSPAQRLQQLNQLVTGVFMPALPMMMQQGVSVNFAELAKTYSKYADLPELLDIIKTGSGPAGLAAGSDGGEGGEANTPTQTHRVNERISRPGATPQGAQQTLVNTLMGGNNQPSENQAATRQLTGMG
jgi:hypothetical protein